MVVRGQRPQRWAGGMDVMHPYRVCMPVCTPDRSAAQLAGRASCRRQLACAYVCGR